MRTREIEASEVAWEECERYYYSMKKVLIMPHSFSFIHR